MAIPLLPDEITARKKEMKQFWFCIYLVVVTAVLWWASPYINQLIIQVKEYYPKPVDTPEWVEVEYLAVDGRSRTGDEMLTTTGIVLHSAEPGLNAKQVWRRYQNEKYSESAHFIVDTDGTILQCIPLEELSTTPGMGTDPVFNIVICSKTGYEELPIHQEKALAKLCAWLVEDCFLNVGDVKRHSDVAQNLTSPCPLYYASNEKEWREFLSEINWSITEGDWKK